LSRVYGFATVLNGMSFPVCILCEMW